MQEIQANELKKVLKIVVLIDVREADEFSNHIQGAINKPIGALIRDIGKLGETLIPKNKDVVLYCGSGVRSSIAAKFLEEKGWNNIKSLKGGFTAWKV